MSFFSDAGNYALGGGSFSDYSVPGLSGIFSGGPEKKNKSRKTEKTAGGQDHLDFKKTRKLPGNGLIDFKGKLKTYC